MRRALAVVAVALAGLLVACGVEVPDDVAEDLRSTTTTEAAAPATTEAPRSDDELEQALIDNGYTAEEATCGAENLREALDDDEIRSIVDAATIEDISASTARAFADALRPCVEDGAGAGPERPEPPDRPDPDDPDEDGDDDEAGPGGLGRMPGFGDDSEGDVSRSRFLSALISGGIDDEAARCIVAEVYAELDQDDINTLFHAQSESEVPDDVLDVFMDITEQCR